MESITLKINGMHCTGCSTRLEKVLKNTDGVETASVDLETKEAKISFDGTITSVEKLYEAVEDAGFEVEK